MPRAPTASTTPTSIDRLEVLSRKFKGEEIRKLSGNSGHFQHKVRRVEN
jgi:hypothetical protein